jgi:hypothetical protein
LIHVRSICPGTFPWATDEGLPAFIRAGFIPTLQHRPKPTNHSRQTAERWWTWIEFSVMGAYPLMVQRFSHRLQADQSP